MPLPIAPGAADAFARDGWPFEEALVSPGGSRGDALPHRSDPAHAVPVDARGRVAAARPPILVAHQNEPDRRSVPDRCRRANVSLFLGYGQSEEWLDPRSLSDAVLLERRRGGVRS